VSAQTVTSLRDVTKGQAPKSPILNINILSGHKFEDLTNGRGKKKERSDLSAPTQEGEGSSEKPVPF
jgi:hypothetical protein